MFGGIEAGGTKFVCGVGTGPEDLKTVRIPTRTPEATIDEVVAFFCAQGPVEAIGIGSFGPVDLRSGHITSTPKEGWQGFDLAGAIRRGMGVPVEFDTDTNAAALGEARWGAARGLADFVYITVGTGIGGGAMVNGELLHGLVHAEMGHMRLPHDRMRDPFAGGCPYHGDCLEGLACGPAVEARWGRAARELPPEHDAWILEAEYLALALNNVACVLSPEKVILGGGVMEQEHLFGMVRQELAKLLNGYTRAPELAPPELGGRAGVLGALVLAERALQAVSTNR